jgi:hypothetical protein
MYFCRVHTLFLYATLRKKLSDFPEPIRDVTNQTLTLVSDIPGTGKSLTIFYSVVACQKSFPCRTENRSNRFNGASSDRLKRNIDFEILLPFL